MRNTAHTISHKLKVSNKLNEMKHSKRNGKRVSKNEESEVSVEFNQRNTEQWNWEYDSIDYSQTRVVQALVFVKRWFDSTGEDSLRAYAYTRLFEYRHANTYTQAHEFIRRHIQGAKSLFHSILLSITLLLPVRSPAYGQFHRIFNSLFLSVSFSLSFQTYIKTENP